MPNRTNQKVAQPVGVDDNATATVQTSQSALAAPGSNRGASSFMALANAKEPAGSGYNMDAWIAQKPEDEPWNNLQGAHIAGTNSKTAMGPADAYTGGKSSAGGIAGSK